MQLNLHNWAEIAAAVTCSICLLAKPSVTNRWFCWFLWFTVLVELTGKVLTPIPTTKVFMYNLYMACEYICYSGFFIKATILLNRKILIAIASYGFAIFYVINISLFQKPFVYNTHSALLLGCLLSFFCLLYYHDLIRSTKTELHKWSKLLIVSGILLFYADSIGIFHSYNTLAAHAPAKLVKIYTLIVRNLSVILYSLLTIGFVVEISEAKKTFTPKAAPNLNPDSNLQKMT